MRNKAWMTWAVLMWMVFAYGLYFFMVKDAPQLLRARRGVARVMGHCFEKAGG